MVRPAAEASVPAAHPRVTPSPVATTLDGIGSSMSAASRNTPSPAAAARLVWLATIAAAASSKDGPSAR
jgi:hypothetical protein